MTGNLHNIKVLNTKTIKAITPLYLGTHLTSIFLNSENPDEMQHYAAFHPGLHCL